MSREPASRASLLPADALPSRLGPLVSADWLAAHLAEVHVVDLRWYLDGRCGRDAYLAGHIPGAVWLDLDADLAAAPSAAGGRHPLPAPDTFAAALGAAGIADGQPVVACDDAGGSIAARLWWLLDVLGEPVAVLDGGIAAWRGALVEDIAAPVPVTRMVRDWPSTCFVTADEVANAATVGTSTEARPGGRTAAVIYDARTAERYTSGADTSGVVAGPDPRPGHIPGALSAPWHGNLDESGLFLPAERLRERFASAAGRRTIAYCGSGVTACHDLLAMRLAGLDDTALYPGSWSEWAADPSRPAEIGESGPAQLRS